MPRDRPQKGFKITVKVSIMLKTIKLKLHVQRIIYFLAVIPQRAAKSTLRDT